MNGRCELTGLSRSPGTDVDTRFRSALREQQHLPFAELDRDHRHALIAEFSELQMQNHQDDSEANMKLVCSLAANERINWVIERAH